jgi:peptidoglycan hydrolase-like protein with peptidoglycan-binding domain
MLPQLSHHAKSKGRHVRTLQGLLHARGLGKVVGKIDGDFGKKTDEAVRSFQRRALIRWTDWWGKNLEQVIK